MITLDTLKDQATDHSVKETLFYVKFSLSFNSLSKDVIDLTKDLFEQIATRDKWTSFSVETWGTPHSIDNKESFDSCYEFIAENSADWDDEDEDEIGIRFTAHIEKHIHNNQLTVYSLCDFYNFLKKNSLISTLKNLSERIASYSSLVFECIDEDISLGSDTIQFVSPNTAIEISLFNREKATDTLREYNLDTNCPANLFPSDFQLTEEKTCYCGFEDITSFFIKSQATLALSSISNSFNISNDDKVKFVISGYKKNTIEEKELSTFTTDAVLQPLTKIQSWIFSDGETVDKLQLARNILSLHANDEDITFNCEVFLAIQSNYNIYLQENVTTYIEVKNKITEIIIQSSIKNSELCDSFLSYFRGNCIALLTFFLSAFFIKSVDSEAAYTTNTHILIGASLVLLTLSFLWLFFVKKDLTGRFKHNRDLLNSTITNNYQHILLKSEIENLTANTQDKNGQFFRDSIKRYSRIWGITSFVLVGLYIIILLVLAKGAVVENPRPRTTIQSTISSQLHTTPSYPSSLK